MKTFVYYLFLVLIIFASFGISIPADHFDLMNGTDGTSFIIGFFIVYLVLLLAIYGIYYLLMRYAFKNSYDWFVRIISASFKAQLVISILCMLEFFVIDPHKSASSAELTLKISVCILLLMPLTIRKYIFKYD